MKIEVEPHPRSFFLVRGFKGANHSEFAPMLGNRYDSIYKKVKEEEKANEYQNEKEMAGFVKSPEKEEEKEIKAFDEKDVDVALLNSYGHSQYAKALKAVETDITDRRENEHACNKESDTDLSPPNLWDLPYKQSLHSEQHLLVARDEYVCADSDDPK